MRAWMSLGIVLSGACASATTPGNPFATQGTGSWRSVAPAPSAANFRTSGAPPHLFFTGTDVLLTSGGLFAYDPVGDLWSTLIDVNVNNYSTGGALVWTGTRIIYFGGAGCGLDQVEPCPLANSYDTAAHQFATISTQGAPAFRILPTAMWTGSRVLVWGGISSAPDPAGGWDNTTYNDGGLYDPISDTWTTISSATAPAPRSLHSAVWTGTEMLVWGGWTEMAGTVKAAPTGATASGATPAVAGVAYDPNTDTWSTLPTAGQPAARGSHAAVWTGTEMIVWGGSSDSAGASGTGRPMSDGGAYNPTTRTWRGIRSAPSSGLMDSTVVWTGSRMVVWGGYDTSGYSNLGYSYDPTTDTWEYVTTVNAPTPRVGYGATWAGTSLMIWGGVASYYFYNDGALWSPPSDAGP